MRTFLHSQTAFTLYGTLLGFLFPLIGLMLLAFKHSCNLVTAHAQYGGMLIYIVECAPIILGISFFFLGKKHSQIINLNNELISTVNLKTKEAISSRLLYEKQKTIAQLSVTYNHQINNPLTVALAIAEQLKEVNQQDRQQLTILIKNLQTIGNVVIAIDELRKRAAEDINIIHYANDVEMIDIT